VIDNGMLLPSIALGRDGTGLEADGDKDHARSSCQGLDWTVAGLEADGDEQQATATEVGCWMMGNSNRRGTIVA
jgi:hypothetical protein